MTRRSPESGPAIHQRRPFRVAVESTSESGLLRLRGPSPGCPGNRSCSAFVTLTRVQFCRPGGARRLAFFVEFDLDVGERRSAGFGSRNTLVRIQPSRLCLCWLASDPPEGIGGQTRQAFCALGRAAEALVFQTRQAGPTPAGHSRRDRLGRQRQTTLAQTKGCCGFESHLGHCWRIADFRLQIELTAHAGQRVQSSIWNLQSKERPDGPVEWSSLSHSEDRGFESRSGCWSC